MICQPSLFAHINSRYHAFKSEVLKDSHCETAQFWARYMDIIQMVLTLIRDTRKTPLNYMSALSVCLVPKVHCTQSQQVIDKGYFYEAFLFKPRGGPSPPSGLNRKLRKNPLFSL